MHLLPPHCLLQKHVRSCRTPDFLQNVFLQNVFFRRDKTFTTKTFLNSVLEVPHFKGEMPTGIEKILQRNVFLLQNEPFVYITIFGLQNHHITTKWVLQNEGCQPIFCIVFLLLSLLFYRGPSPSYFIVEISTGMPNGYRTFFYYKMRVIDIFFGSQKNKIKTKNTTKWENRFM